MSYVVIDANAHLMNSGMYLGCMKHQAVSWHCTRLQAATNQYEHDLHGVKGPHPL